MTAVVTELVIDPTEAEQGANAFSFAMAKAAQASNDNLKSIADNTAALNKQIGGLGDATHAAAEASSTHWGAFAAKIALGAAAAALGIGAIYAAFKLLYEIVTFVPAKLAEAWELGNAKLAEYVALAEKAAAANVTTDFLQRITKAAEGAKLPVDALTESLKKLNETAGLKLGGSDATKRLGELTEAGNFEGNKGVDQFKNANGTEEKLRAVAGLYDQALQKGERLAGLDFAKTVLGDEVAKNLANDSAYLDKMLASADAIKQKDLISSDDVMRAQDLQNRLDAAEKILSQRWHPIQDALTSLGIKMKEAWVAIVEQIAAAFDLIAKMIDKIPPAFWTIVGTGVSLASGAAAAVAGPVGTLFGIGGRIAGAGLSALDSSGSTERSPDPTAGQVADARRRLAEGLNRQFDTSKDPNAKKPDAPDTSAYDRAEESLRKYIETTKAAAETVDQSTAAQERAKAMAQLVAAAMKDGLSREAATAKAQMSGLADAAASAAEALAKARVAADIKFNRNAALLSSEDVQIATQLKGLYPDVATALGSVEANAIRTNNAMKGLTSALENNLTSGLTDIVSGTKSVSQGFHDMAASILKDIEQVLIKALIVGPLLRSFGLSGVGGLLGGGASSGNIVLGGAGGPGQFTTHAHGNMFANGNVIPFAQGGIVDSPTIAPMALFGESGPEAIVPLRRGPDGNLGIASAGGGGGDTHVWNINAAGADSGTVEALKGVVIQLSDVVRKQGKAMASAQREQATGVS